MVLARNISLVKNFFRNSNPDENKREKNTFNITKLINTFILFTLINGSKIFNIKEKEKKNFSNYLAT